MEDKNILNIGKASKYLGVSIDTLRRWERKGKVTTYRSPGGHRYFKKEDLDQLFGQRYARMPKRKSVKEVPQTLPPNSNQEDTYFGQKDYSTTNQPAPQSDQYSPQENKPADLLDLPKVDDMEALPEPDNDIEVRHTPTAMTPPVDLSELSDSNEDNTQKLDSLPDSEPESTIPVGSGQDNFSEPAMTASPFSQAGFPLKKDDISGSIHSQTNARGSLETAINFVNYPKESEDAVPLPAYNLPETEDAISSEADIQSPKPNANTPLAEDVIPEVTSTSQKEAIIDIPKEAIKPKMSGLQLLAIIILSLICLFNIAALVYFLIF